MVLSFALALAMRERLAGTGWLRTTQLLPMVFLLNARDNPLGVFLAVQSGEAISLAGSGLSMLPVLLLFLYFRDELSEGVEFLGVRG